MNYTSVYNISLKSYNTLKLEAKAYQMVFPFNYRGVQEIYEENNKNKEIIIIGKGSNILLSKEYYDESYIFLNFKLMDNIEIIENQVYVESGATLSNLSWFTLENNIKGYEFLEDVPGSIGGAIVMNAGTYEDTIGQMVISVTYYDIKNNCIRTDKVNYSEDFGRRQSKWTSEGIVILSCELKKQAGDYIETLDKLLEIKKRRYMKQPRNYPNAGSVFKRPTKNGEDFYVWELITDVGLRGYKKNDAMISDKHPGFIVNIGNAKFDDIKYLIDLSKEKIMNNFGVELELEWKIL